MAEKIVAVAAGREITEAEFNEFLARIPEQSRAYVQTEEGRRQALTQYANYFLFEAFGKEKKYDENKDYQEMLASTTRELLAQYTLTQEMKQVIPTEEECRAYFEKKKAAFAEGAKASAKHILTDSEEQSLRILEEIKSGKKSFEDAAKEYSSCPSSAKGGDLGTFSRGQMVPEFDEAVFGAETGSLLGPVKTQFGYHLIRVDALNQGQEATFEKALPQILNQLTNQKQNDAYMALRASLIEKYGLEFK